MIFERLRQRGKFHHVAFGGRFAVEQIVPRGTGIGPQLGHHLRPVPGHARRHRKAVLGETDGGRQRAIEPEAAVGIEYRRPGVDRARHRDGVYRVAPDGADPLGEQRLG